MYCKHCGKEIADDSKFCQYCGKAQDNNVPTSNGLVDFVTNRPVVSLYILWVIINVTCLCRGEKNGKFYNLLYPRFFLDGDNFDLNYYQITDFIVYTILIPLVIFLGYHYFKKVTSIKYRICWGLWFFFHVLMYNLSNLRIDYYFFPFYPFTQAWYYSSHYDDYSYLSFVYNVYDLSELVFYTMIIPIAYWGYIYYKDRKKQTNTK